jgi:hypothetical protein
MAGMEGPSPKSDPQTVRPVSNSYTEYAMPEELRRVCVNVTRETVAHDEA